MWICGTWCGISERAGWRTGQQISSSVNASILKKVYLALFAINLEHITKTNTAEPYITCHQFHMTISSPVLRRLQLHHGVTAGVNQLLLGPWWRQQLLQQPQQLGAVQKTNNNDRKTGPALRLTILVTQTGRGEVEAENTDYSENATVKGWV